MALAVLGRGHARVARKDAAERGGVGIAAGRGNAGHALQRDLQQHLGAGAAQSVQVVQRRLRQLLLEVPQQGACAHRRRLCQPVQRVGLVQVGLHPGNGAGECAVACGGDVLLRVRLQRRAGAQVVGGHHGLAGGGQLRPQRLAHQGDGQQVHIAGQRAAQPGAIVRQVLAQAVADAREVPLEPRDVEPGQAGLPPVQPPALCGQPGAVAHGEQLLPRVQRNAQLAGQRLVPGRHGADGRDVGRMEGWDEQRLGGRVGRRTVIRRHVGRQGAGQGRQGQALGVQQAPGQVGRLRPQAQAGQQVGTAQQVDELQGAAHGRLWQQRDVHAEHRGLGRRRGQGQK